MSYIYKAGRAELYEQVKRHGHLIKGNVLDIGARGSSRYKHFFNYTEYYPMDIEAGEGIDRVGRIENIPYSSDTFDSVVCIQVLGDVFELKTAFSEMYRVLRPKGVLLATESLFDPLHDEPNDYWRFTSHSLRRLAEEAGFTVMKIEGRGNYRSVIGNLKMRYWKNRLKAHGKWFARPLSLLFKVYGTLTGFFKDNDTSHVNGYILLCSK